MAASKFSTGLLQEATFFRSEPRISGAMLNNDEREVVNLGIEIDRSLGDSTGSDGREPHWIETPRQQKK